MLKRNSGKWLLILLAVLVSCPVLAQTTYSDNFMGKKSQLDWVALNDACLTAGSQTGTSSVSNPIIPSCASKNISVGADETVDGQGALLLTPAENNQTGAILSGFAPFSLSQGIQITFTTYTYGGNNGGTAKNGADGIVFFLTDGTKTPPTTTGGEGGSMGYDCSNGNGVANGIAYGYLGLGIDEFGNFLNSGDNGSEGVYNSRNTNYGTKAFGDNAFQNGADGSISAGSGSQYQPERIGLRGRGNTNWAELHSLNPNYYSDNADKKTSKVQSACKNGQYVSGKNNDGHHEYKDLPFNYSPLKNAAGDTVGYHVLPGGFDKDGNLIPGSQPIANNNDDATRNPTKAVPATGTTPATPATPADEVAWPIAYRLTISPSGLLNFSYSYNNGSFQPVLANFDITQSNGAIPASLRFGFSAGTGGSNNVHEITCFKASPLQANTSAGANTQKSGKVTGHTQFFLAAYSSDTWWGSLVADPLVVSADGIAISSVANWDAKCVLTGAACSTMGTDPTTGVPTHTITAQAASDRVLLTTSVSGAAKGVALQWTDLSTTEQTALNKGKGTTPDNDGQSRVSWLRGVRSVEELQNPPGTLRARRWVLGDIINSSPTFVGQPVAKRYPNNFTDLLDSSATIPENKNNAESYATFVSTYIGRENVVYVGANDGLLHGFRAGSYTQAAAGDPYVYDKSTNDGHEVLGYMPYGVLMNKAVNLADPLYSHDYLVDATPVAGDVFYGGKWHTWLVGGVGSDGKEIYALDVTDPSKFTEANASSLVMGDWDSTTLTHLGHTVGQPIIQRMHNGDWAFIFGSGLGGSGTEGIYIGLIDSSDGSVSFKFLSTGVTPDNSGGIAYVSSVDLDGDHIADYLYAGDTEGNVWRFDVTSSDTTDWKADSTALFVAKDADDDTQPITTAVTVLAIKTGSKYRVMLYFGTGQMIPQTGTSGRQYATGQQTFYGIWDWDMDGWNTLSSTKYASLDGTQSIKRSSLLSQSVVKQTTGGTTADVKGYRSLSTSKVVCWKGSGTGDACSADDQYGWYFDLPDQGPSTGLNAGENEQVIFSPTFIGGAVVVNSTTPPVVSALQCSLGLQSGWTMAFNPKTGGGLKENFFPGGSSSGGTTDNSTVSGVKLGGVGTPTSVRYGGKSYLVTQTVTGAGVIVPFKPQTGNTPARVSWRELVNP